MEEIKKLVAQKLEEALGSLEISTPHVQLSHPENLEHGDLTTNVAMSVFAKLASSDQRQALRSPRDLAQKIVDELNSDVELKPYFSKISVEGPGFINFWLDKTYLLNSLQKIISDGEEYGKSKILSGKKVMVEYAHPNTHKEMHIGHMRTLITGEAICRMLEANGAEVFRANYQGDIGPHVAKAIWGIQKMMEEKKLTLDEIEKWSNNEKAHFLGEGYVRGSKDYETHKEDIDALNTKIYAGDSTIKDLYQRTRQWSLDYYEDFYSHFYTKFDHLFFESEMATRGKEIVQENIGKVFKEDQGAVVFPGEEYGLHTRVFITSAGNPTYEGKEMANAFAEHEAFPFDLKIHVVASEQAGYFKVVLKALDLIDPKLFEGKQYHLSMGMVQLSDSGQARKMSSRTGDVLTVDWLIDQVKENVRELLAEGKIEEEQKDQTIEAITIGAIKYSVLKVGTGQDAAFDIKTSVSLDGNSGPYLQYSYARTQSILRKSQISNPNSQINSQLPAPNVAPRFSRGEVGSTFNSQLNNEESELLRYLLQYPTVVAEAGQSYAPNTIANYLFELAQKFNLFYQKNPILKEEKTKEFRLALTSSVGQVLKNGLDLLGIKTVEKM